MSPPLVRGQRTLDRRFRLLAQKLNDELGFRDQRLRFRKLAWRRGATKWTLRNEHDAADLVSPQNTVAELADATNDQSILYFGYNEEWQPYGGIGSSSPPAT